jgi:hypothetical protein
LVAGLVVFAELFSEAEDLIVLVGAGLVAVALANLAAPCATLAAGFTAAAFAGLAADLVGAGFALDFVGLATWCSAGSGSVRNPETSGQG